MTESTSHVERQVQARIQAAKIRVAAAQQRRDDLAAARKRGLAHRHAAKLRALAEQEQRRLDDEQPQICDSAEQSRKASQPGARRAYERGPFGVRADQGDDHRASVRTTDGTETVTPTASNNTTKENP